jgi:hypothetical protein
MSDAADDCATARASARAARRRLPPRPPVAAPAAIAAGLVALAGCSSASVPNSAVTSAPATSTPAGTASQSAAASGRVSSPAASGTAGSSGSAPASSGSAPAGGPTLGRLAGVFSRGAGFGQVRPARIFNGGDPTGLVTRITWSSWGGGKATGTGTSVYVAPGQSNAQGRLQSATVVAFRLGSCHGTVMYRAVEWYFPQHGQKFSASHYEDICAGSYAPAP